MRPTQHRIVESTPYGFFRGINPYPYAFAPPYYSTPYYAASPYVSSYVEQSFVAPSPSASESELSYQLERLTREVERLRLEQAEAAVRQSQRPPLPEPPPAARAPEPPVPPITLVFRDGRRMSIKSYAVVRETLWVVDDRVSTKIDLSELDLVATQQANAGRVMLLPVPAR
jgi:hypothetical protein